VSLLKEILRRLDELFPHTVDEIKLTFFKIFSLFISKGLEEFEATYTLQWQGLLIDFLSFNLCIYS